MGPYFVTYSERTRIGNKVYFKVDYFSPNKDNKFKLDFSLHPFVQENPIMRQTSAEPDTKHYLDRDIYTHISYVVLQSQKENEAKNGFNEAKNYIGHVGDSIFSSNAIIVIDSLRTNIGQKEYEKNDSLLIVTAVLRAINSKSETFYAYPKYIIKNNIVIPQEAIIKELGLKFVFWKIDPEEGHVEITMSEKAKNEKDFIVMKAFIFPYINVLWLGCLIMAFGTVIAIIERIRKFKLQS
jgi:cytochrome c-type biogenesis protein CcmF